MADSVPEHASVVVVGGGVMGCSTLHHLAEMGVGDAVLVERDQLTAGTTWHSAAQVRALRHSRNLTRMIQYSVDLYGRLEAQTGQSVGWIRNGSLSIATTPDRLTHIRRQEALAGAFGVEARSISVGEARERWPLMRADDVIGAVWSPEDGRVGPSDLCAALAKAARAAGARIFERTGVTGILTEAGRVSGVETTRGVIRCEAVALCAGLWSRALGASAGASVPLWPCEHFYLLTKPIDGIDGVVPTLGDHDGHLYIRDDGGGLLVGCFEPTGKAVPPGVLDDGFAFRLLPEDWDHFEPMMVNALHRLPALETAQVKALVNGPESFTPDGAFMLGETAETRGLFLGCGMNSVGVASGGGAGMNLAHAIVHGRCADDLSEADAKRFAPVFDSVAHLTARAPEVLGTHYEIARPGRQPRTARDLRRLPLHDAHVAAGARFGQVYGWERPLYFGRPEDPALRFGRPDWHDQIGEEVQAAHERAAVFDGSASGKIDLTGPDAEAFLLRVCAGRMGRPPGAVIYSAMLDETGGFISDLTAQRFAPDRYRLSVGAAAIRRDLAWLRRWSVGFDVALSDVTEEFAVLGVMGPQAGAVAAALGAPELARLAYFTHAPARLAGVAVRAARLSYVGEAGWEIACAAADAPALYAALTGQGATPAGLYAQTSMRIEKGFRAMGHELDGDVTPLQTGLGFATRKAGGFIGFDPMRAREGGARVVSLRFADQDVWPIGQEPVRVDGRVVGLTTSAAYGFRVGAPVALAHVEGLRDGQRVQVDIAGARADAEVVVGPLFDPSGARMRPDFAAA